MECFEELQNRPAPQESPDIQPADTNMPVNLSMPTREEIHKAIRQVKNDKSTGPGSTPAEAPKADIETNTEPPYPFLSQIWEEHRSPQSGMRAIVPSSPEKVILAPHPATEE